MLQLRAGFRLRWESPQECPVVLACRQAGRWRGCMGGCTASGLGTASELATSPTRSRNPGQLSHWNTCSVLLHQGSRAFIIPHRSLIRLRRLASAAWWRCAYVSELEGRRPRCLEEACCRDGAAHPGKDGSLPSACCNRAASMASGDVCRAAPALDGPASPRSALNVASGPA